MKVICNTCGCEFEVNTEILSSEKCPICKANISNELANVAPEENKVVSKELMQVPCRGSAFVPVLDRVLFVWNDHIAIIKNNGEVVFDVTYDKVAHLKGGSFWMPTSMKLVLNDGTEHKIELNGNDFSAPKLAKSLPGLVDDLIANYKR